MKQKVILSFSEETTEQPIIYSLVKKFDVQFNIFKAAIEPGKSGKLFLEFSADAVFAGSLPLSEKIGLHIDAKEYPLGTCTSSGTVGPSLSFGKADAVMIVCKNALLADSYATVFANQIQTANDIDYVLEMIENKQDIISALLVKDDKMGIIGKFEMKLFKGCNQ